MRCTTCDYSLWNLKARKCPECGTPFNPSDFEYVINSVRFCCPHCEQAYYGTGPRGHLVPDEFICVTCGQRVNMNEMVLRPAEGVDERQTQVDHAPWLERKQRGFVKGWFGMIGKAMVAPGRLIRSVPEQSSLLQAWWFAIFTSIVIGIVCLAPLMCFMLVPWMGTGGGGPPPSAFYGMGVGMAVMVVVWFFLSLVLMVLWGVATHGLLRVTGKTTFGIGRTYQALCYSSGANALSAVPCVGGYVGWIWWVVSAVLMVKEGQKVSGGRAAFAVLTFPLLTITVLITAYIGLIFAVTSVSRTSMVYSSRTGFANPIADVSSITNGLLGYAASHEGAGPPHAIELTASNGMGVSNFIASGSLATENSVPVADTTLQGLQMLPPNRQKMTAQSAGAALPSDVVAHRLGDFVFTYHGMNLNTCDRGLWIVILWPDPDSNPSPPSSNGLTVGLADGTARVLAGSVRSLLASQNELRAKYGLPPIPDPSTVTHAQPARAKKPETLEEAD